jgi:formate dehydrogenase major subunit
MYSRKDKDGKMKVMHVEGDPDNPVNKGTLCPKGAGLLEMIDSPNRMQFPEIREAGSKEWKRISWDDALTRIAKHMKADRDQNFVQKNADGLTVNRWNTFGMLVSSASNNEAGYLSHKVLRSLGVVALDTQARI